MTPLLAAVLGAAHSLALPTGGALSLELPDDWKEEDAAQRAPTLSLSRADPSARLLISAVPSGKSPRDAARGALEHVQPSAVEPKLELEPLEGTNGFWFTATDRSWKPGTPDDFPIMSQGALEIAGVLVVFTVLHHTKRPPDDAVAALRALRATETLRFGKVRVELPPLLTRREDGLSFRANAGRTNVSLFVEPPHSAAKTNDGVASWYWRSAGTNPMLVASTVRRSATDRFTKVAYEIEARVEGQKVRQRNANYYLVCDGQWVDLHLSVIDPRPGDDAVFGAAERSLACEP